MPTAHGRSGEMNIYNLVPHVPMNGLVFPLSFGALEDTIHYAPVLTSTGVTAGTKIVEGAVRVGSGGSLSYDISHINNLNSGFFFFLIRPTAAMKSGGKYSLIRLHPNSVNPITSNAGMEIYADTKKIVFTLSDGTTTRTVQGTPDISLLDSFAVIAQWDTAGLRMDGSAKMALSVNGVTTTGPTINVPATIMDRMMVQSSKYTGNPNVDMEFIVVSSNKQLEAHDIARWSSGKVLPYDCRQIYL